MYTGELVRLRAYKEEDLILAQQYINNPEIKQYLETGVPFLYTQHNEKEWYEKQSPFADEYGFAIETLEDNRYIGGCGVHKVDYKNRKTNIGIFIGDEEYLGKGYGTDALKVLVKFIFEEMNMNKVRLEVYDFNLRAQKCYEKVGFNKEAILKKNYLGMENIGILSL